MQCHPKSDPSVCGLLDRQLATASGLESAAHVAHAGTSGELHGKKYIQDPVTTAAELPV